MGKKQRTPRIRLSVGVIGAIWGLVMAANVYADRTACESASCRTGGYSGQTNESPAVVSSGYKESTASATNDSCPVKPFRPFGKGQLTCGPNRNIDSRGCCVTLQKSISSDGDRSTGYIGIPDLHVEDDNNQAIEHEYNQADIARMQAGSAAIASAAASLMQNAGGSTSEVFDNLSSESHNRVRELREWSSTHEDNSRSRLNDGETGADGEGATILAKAESDKILEDLKRIRSKAPSTKGEIKKPSGREESQANAEHDSAGGNSSLVSGCLTGTRDGSRLVVNNGCDYGVFVQICANVKGRASLYHSTAGYADPGGRITATLWLDRDEKIINWAYSWCTGNHCMVKYINC
jgi:hypothetical protein